MATKLQPLADRVVIKPMPKEDVTKGGIVLPDTAKEKPMEGKVLAKAELGLVYSRPASALGQSPSAPSQAPATRQ